MNYGDDSPPKSIPLEPDGTFLLNHVYVQSGIFDVTVTVSDGEGAGRGFFTIDVSAIAVADAIVDVGTGIFNSLAIGANELPVITFWDPTNSSLKMALCIDVVCSGVATNTVDGGDGVGFSPSVAIGVDNLPVISYRDGRNGALNVAHCNDPVCSDAFITTVDSSGDLAISDSITIGVDGLPIINYSDLANGVLKVAHCEDRVCSSSSITTVDDLGDFGQEISGDLGRDISMAIGTDGRPIISYRDSANSDLKVAHCDDVLCDRSVTVTLDTRGEVGPHTSIAIAADGLPIVGYGNLSGSAVKVAQCNDITYRSSTISNIVDAEFPFFIAIAIGVDDLPVIGYVDLANEVLRVAHCRNEACTASLSVQTFIQAVAIKRDSATFAFGSDGAGNEFECRLDSGFWEDCSSPWTYVDLSEGVHRFQVRAVGGLGNVDSSPAIHTWIVAR